MNEKLESVLEMPLQKRLGVLGVSCGIVFGAFYLYFYSPVASELETLIKKIDGPDGLRAQITEKQAIADNLDIFQAEVEKLNVELRRAMAQLPDKKEIPQLLSKVSDKARDSGLEVKLFRPDAEQKKDFYSEVPVHVELTGTYHQVASFFDEVGRLDRIVNLDGLSLTEPVVSDESVTLKAQVVATAFRFLDESERPQEQGQEGNLKKKRRGAAKPAEVKK